MEDEKTEGPTMVITILGIEIDMEEVALASCEAGKAAAGDSYMGLPEDLLQGVGVPGAVCVQGCASW